MTIFLHRGDLPDDVTFDGAVAVDSETLGLNPLRDRLCVVQLSSGNGDAHLVQFDGKSYEAPNLKRVLTDPDVVKIFHFARFDYAVFRQWLGIETAPLYCTKIASKLARTYTDRHGLKDVVRELVGVELSKQQQSSDWALTDLSDAQQTYAAADVLYLHEVKAKLDLMLQREGRMGLAKASFAYLPIRAELDLKGWGEVDIFAHS